MSAASMQMQELERRRADYAEAQAAAAEAEASDALELQDARLMRVRLSAIVQRYQERKPSMEDLSNHYETELDSLEAEIRLLREENGLLATRDTEDLDACAASRPRVARGRRAWTVAEELCQEACELRLSHAQASKKARSTRLAQMFLEAMKAETRQTVARLKVQEQCLQELRSRHVQTETYLRELLDAQLQLEDELELERSRLRELHRHALNMREACYVPARLKKETTFLMKMLQHDGGRLKTSRHLRSLEACRRLYQEVASTAPNLLPLAGRAKAEMEEEFAKYLKLEESHCSALQRLQLAVTRGLQRP